MRALKAHKDAATRTAGSRSDAATEYLVAEQVRSRQSRREIALAMAAVWHERYLVATDQERRKEAYAARERWKRETREGHFGRDSREEEMREMTEELFFDRNQKQSWQLTQYSNITQLCNRAVEMANEGGVRVEFDFNGTKVLVEPGEDPRAVERRRFGEK